MSKVLITRSKLDGLATTIAAKSGEPLPLTIAQMDAAVGGIVIGGGTDTSHDTVDAAHLLDGYTAHDSTGTAITGTYVPPTFSTQSKTATPTEQQQTVAPDSGYDGLSSVTVGAIPSTYVGTGITQRSLSDLTASGATVTAPAGYYASAATKSVESGTEGTPTATKGSVSNHAVSVTPSVTNSAGYISGGTHTGTAVTVSASELVSGSETKTANGTYDVTNLASLVVNVASSGASIDTKTVTASNYPTSISFSSMKGQPKAFFLRSTSQISSSGSTTYYYIVDMVYDGNSNRYCNGNCFRIGSTRRVDPITTSSSGGTVTGYTWSYSGTTLTITTSAGSRSSSPGAFNNGYQLVYVY